MNISSKACELNSTDFIELVSFVPSQTTQLVPAKQTSHLLCIGVRTREKRMTAFAFRPFPYRLREESVQQSIGKRQENADRNKYLMCCGCCCNSIYFKAPFSQLHSIQHTHRASMQTIQFASPHSSYPKHTHYDTRSTLRRDRSTVFLKQKVVRSWATQCDISQDNSTRWWWAVSTSRDSRQTLA